METSNELEAFKREIKAVSIQAQTDEEADIYLTLAKKVEEFLKQIYDEEKKTLEFPIDVQMIGAHLGFTFERKPLNQIGSNQFDKTLGQISCTSNGKIILIDNSVSGKTQQYAIAHLIGRYLLLGEDKIYENSYAIPLMPSKLEEIAADKIALFLLMPIGLFKKEFKEYLRQVDDKPMDVDLWLQHLSDKSQMTMFNLAIGYQQIKEVTCLERMKEFEDNDYDFANFNDEYAELFA